MSTLWYATHPEVVIDPDVPVPRWGLSERGRSRAHDLADRDEMADLTRIVSSDEAKAVETAEIVAGDLGVDVVVRKGLREFGVGAAAGTTGDPDPFAATFAAWLDGDLAARIPGGESGAEVVERYTAVLDEIADAHRGESVLVVSHADRWTPRSRRSTARSARARRCAWAPRKRCRSRSSRPARSGSTSRSASAACRAAA